MTLYHWDSMEREHVNPLFDRRLINGEAMTVARLDLKKGCFVPLHSHHNEQISLIETGRMKFTIEGQEILMGPGDVLHIPRNVPHSAEVLEDMTGIDLFSPPREDWINKTDAYLRDQK